MRMFHIGDMLFGNYFWDTDYLRIPRKLGAVIYVVFLSVVYEWGTQTICAGVTHTIRTNQVAAIASLLCNTNDTSLI
uniref:Uncharacterized protein n=1 Tax=Arion vulgaris TaxID=1028688 RepID=A0A0B6ZP73_9EUPU